MKPGPELDALVAEKVMGWKWENFGKPMLAPPEQIIQITEFCDKHTGYREVNIYIPPYSTDISAAWQVVEKLKKDHVFSLKIAGNGTHAHVSFTDLDNKNYDPCDNIPHAICLAALKAVSLD